MIIVRDSWREELDYATYNMKDISYPKKLGIGNGTSMVYQLDKENFFKSVVHEGDSLVDYQQSSGLHHRVKAEENSSYDDYAEVICYYLAKNLGTKERTDNFGNIETVPVVNNAVYSLATFYDKNGYPHRGCKSENIAKPGEVLIKARDLFMPLRDPSRPGHEVRNSLSNHLKAVQAYVDRQNGSYGGPRVHADKNIKNDLLTDAYMNYRVSNSDNHSNNIVYVQRTLPDGSKMLCVAPGLDRGASWEMMIGGCLNLYKSIIEKNTDENGTFTLTDSPFKHQAFHLDAGKLNGHSKTLDGRDLSQEYEFAAHALSDPEFYDTIYRVEQNMDLRKVYAELAVDYRAKFPEEVMQLTIADNELKGHLMTAVMGNYFCYTAFKACIGEIDEQNPSELYTIFQEQMTNLPLQENIEGYMDAFRNIAKENQVEIDEEKLGNLSFLPQDDLSQDTDLSE